MDRLAPFDDWVRSPNISANPDIYELENQAIERDGRLDMGLHSVAPWDELSVVDLGCGTGFWLERYAQLARHVIGVEPDPELLSLAQKRISNHPSIEVKAGSAESLPMEDRSVDLVHARFAYFFGEGCDAGLAEVGRVLAPGGVLVVVDNSWAGGDFAKLLRASTTGNAAIDPDASAAWWDQRGAVHHEVQGGWLARSVGELGQILRIEFPEPVVVDFMADHITSSLTYNFALYEWRPIS